MFDNRLLWELFFLVRSADILWFYSLFWFSLFRIFITIYAWLRKSYSIFSIPCKSFFFYQRNSFFFLDTNKIFMVITATFYSNHFDNSRKDMVSDVGMCRLFLLDFLPGIRLPHIQILWLTLLKLKLASLHVGK